MPPRNLSAERNHTCKFCGKLFQFKWSLTEHVRRTHDEKKPHKCDICSKSFISKSDLKNHVTIHNERLFKCEYCEKTFKTIKNRSLHEDTHGFNEYQCSICKETFKKVINLYSHRKVHRKSSSYNCPFCYSTFSTLEFKIEHVSKVHKSLTDREVMQKEKQKNSRPKVMQESESFSMPPYSCISCGQTFKSTHYLAKHIKSAHPGENIFHQICQVCGKKISINYFRSHMMSHYNIKPFACDVCDSRFVQQHDLNIHQTVHNTLRIFKCSECNSELKCQQSLQKHKTDVHSSNIYSCNICSKLFKTTYCLKLHTKRVHKKSENSKKCPVCNVEIFYKNLSMHMKQVHDEIESLCEICGITCKNAWYLKHHLKTCKKELIMPLDHMKTCPYCTSKFQTIMDLKNHCLLNHAEKIIKCRICDHISICKVSFDRHQKRHNSIPQSFRSNENFECHFCGFCAVGTEGLALHVKEHEHLECYLCGFIASGSHILAEHFKSHEYYKWLLSWNKVVSCNEKSIYVANAYCHDLNSTDHTLIDNYLLIRPKKEISWIHYKSDTKSKVYRGQRKAKIHQVEKNEVTKQNKTKENNEVEAISEIYLDKENEAEIVDKPTSKIIPSRSYFLANPCLKSKSNSDSVKKSFNTMKVDSLKPEIIDLDIDEDSSLSLFCNEKLDEDKIQDDVEKNHCSVNAIDAPNINAGTQINFTDKVPLKPYIYIEDLQKLDICRLKDLLKSF